MKKPLVLDFLDYGSPERRRTLCEEEVRLNKALAPEIYLGVRGVVLTGAGAQLTAADDPHAVDYVVEMRRFAERDTLAATLDQGELTREQVEAVAARVAEFHAKASPITNLEAPVLAAERQFERNLQELLACVEQRDRRRPREVLSGSRRRPRRGFPDRLLRCLPRSGTGESGVDTSVAAAPDQCRARAAELSGA